MNSASQVMTQEISDADLDNVSGGLISGVAGEATIMGPVSAHIAGGGTISTPDITGLLPTTALSA